MKKYIISINFFSLLMVVHAIHAEKDLSCLLLAKQQALLQNFQATVPERDLRKGLEYNGVLELPESHGMPPVVLSEKLLPDCEARWVATKYVSNKLFSEKIYNKAKYRVQRKEFLKHKRAICTAVVTIVASGYRWLVSATWTILDRPVYQIVSEELMPEWREFLYNVITAREVHLDYFTESTFFSPDEKLKPFIDRDLGKNLADTSVAVLYMLRKNFGEILDLEFVANDLRKRELGKNENQEQLIIETLRLLSKEGRISLKDARKFRKKYVGIM